MIKQAAFGVLPDGRTVDAFYLSLPNGFSANILTWGATLQSILAPDWSGRFDGVVLGYETLADYRSAPARLGATMGRYANRVSNGRFVLDGTPFRLAANEGAHAIHGGPEGFDQRLWSATAIEDDPIAPLVGMRLVSPDGDQGFPGTLTVDCSYGLRPPFDLVMTYRATTDQPTVLNLTNHAYFNLGGEGMGSTLDHLVTIFADRYLPVSDMIIPTGEQRDVSGTVFDFRTAKPLGRDIRADDQQISYGRGFDHCYVLPVREGRSPALAAHVLEPETGRALEVLTTEPGLQLHSGNVLTGQFCGPRRQRYRQTDGFCLEAQHFPDSPNQPAFPSTVLRPGEVYSATTIYRFGIA